MANPKLHLPPELTEASIRELVRSLRLPDPITVKPIAAIAEYHRIYSIIFPPEAASSLQPAKPSEIDGSVALILRVAGKHLPEIKTLNEIAAMKWVQDHTTVPIPAVVAFDASEGNPIGHEFTLLEKAEGVSVDTIYDSLHDSKKEYIVSQLAAYLIDMHHSEWRHAGGLSLDQTGKVIPGRVVAETFWQAPEIHDYWGPEETVDTLNPHGPYETYTSFLKGHIKQYARNIQKHESLEWMRDLIPRLKAFGSMLDCRAEELNDTKYILTHRDLHLGNVMCDPETARITAILDWEFAAVLPLPLWTPGGGFLWNGQNTPGGLEEQKRLFEVFERGCGERDPSVLDAFKTKPPHDSFKKIFNFIRAIVEVCPRDQKAEAARSWRKSAEESLADLGL